MELDISELLDQAEDGYLINWRKSDGSVDFFCRNTAGDNLIHVAVGRENIQEIEFLLEKGLDINCQGDFLCTPLHLAARAKDRAIYEFLVSKGGDESILDCMGNSPRKLINLQEESGGEV